MLKNSNPQTETLTEVFSPSSSIIGSCMPRDRFPFPPEPTPALPKEITGVLIGVAIGIAIGTLLSSKK